MAFEQVFKNIDNALRTDEGCSSELDYVEQSSWILFLKYLDDLDKENEMAKAILDVENKTHGLFSRTRSLLVLEGVLSESNQQVKDSLGVSVIEGFVHK